MKRCSEECVPKWKALHVGSVGLCVLFGSVVGTLRGETKTIIGRKQAACFPSLLRALDNRHFAGYEKAWCLHFLDFSVPSQDAKAQLSFLCLWLPIFNLSALGELGEVVGKWCVKSDSV